jgi:hypothetical protein
MPEAKVIQVTSTATKHANKCFLSRPGGFFPYFSLWVEGWLWVGWVVSYGGFDCCFLFVVGGARNELESTLLTLVLTPLKTNTNLYVDLVALSTICLKSSSIIFLLKMIFLRCAIK